MRLSSLPFTVVRRRSWIVLSLAIFVPLMALPVAAASFPDAATPAPATVPRVAEPLRLFDDLPVLLDRFGRTPVGRITFEPGATLSPNLLVVPLVAIVEKGTFEVTVNGVVTKVGPLDQVKVDGDSRTSVENGGLTTGSLIAVAQMSVDNFAGFTLWLAPESEPAPGIVTNALALMQSPLDRLAPRLISVDLLDIPAGKTHDSLDFDGSTATESLVVVVIEGAIESDNGEMVAAGESVELYAEDTETAWHVFGANTTTLLIFRVAEAPED